MNWDAIGAIAETLGAAGVIITLAYLAVQVRQNSRLLERSAEATRVTADDAVVENFNEWREMIITSPQVADLFIRGMEDPTTLGANERLRFNYILSTFCWTAWQMWRAQALMGTPNAHIFQHFLRHRGGREWYLDHRPFFPPDFRDSVDAELQSIDESDLADLGPTDVSGLFAGPLATKPRSSAN